MSFHWLHVMTGFQLYVVSCLISLSARGSMNRYKETKDTRKPDTAALVTAALLSFEALVISVYWWWVAAWPALFGAN